MDDPDKGKWTYKHDALNRLISQTDAKGQITKLQYDKLDRLRKRIDDAHKPPQQQEVTTWLYDKSYKGLLDKVTSAQTTRSHHVALRQKL
ncbi:RHS repeat protein [Endozoicomonas sp. SM1973]|uniref:RHS repeat protein n=3 Tax=Spartinivicinus marinus TaxID=2994442 RepID=A0A853IB44_9GAMM|nr:RHS repeat protein [Spartinivicinus marinus]